MQNFFSDDRCILYRAFVSKYYTLGGALIFDQCYSSFTHPRDVIERERPFSTSSSTNFDNRRLSSFAINGFYCYGHDYGWFSVDMPAAHTKIHWWLIDLKRVVNVESIVVVVPVENRPYNHYFFDHAIIRLGNDPTYSKNTQVFEHRGRPEHMMPFKITLSSSYSGRYLSIETTELIHLGIGSVQVIERNELK